MRLDEAYSVAVAVAGGGSGRTGEDPALDQFMEAYCEMLTKYEQELTKPFEDAKFFLHTLERQFKALTIDSPFNFGNNSPLFLSLTFNLFIFLSQFYLFAYIITMVKFFFFSLAVMLIYMYVLVLQ